MWNYFEHTRSLPESLKSRTRSLLLSRRAWAYQLLKVVDKGQIPPKDFSHEELFVASAHHDNDIDTLVRKHWGNVRCARRKRSSRKCGDSTTIFAPDRVTSRTARHSSLSTAQSCHKLNSEGGTLGPDLTHANRGDRDYLLVSLVDPSAVIRKEFLSYTAETLDNRLITGMITAQTPTTITLTNAKVEATTLKRDEIVSLRESPVSLMPEGLLTPLKPAELRDLFAYLQQPMPKK